MATRAVGHGFLLCPSPQWFVRCDEMAAKSVDLVRSGEMVIRYVRVASWYPPTASLSHVWSAGPSRTRRSGTDGSRTFKTGAFRANFGGDTVCRRTESNGEVLLCLMKSA